MYMYTHIQHIFVHAMQPFVCVLPSLPQMRETFLKMYALATNEQAVTTCTCICATANYTRKYGVNGTPLYKVDIAS